MWGRVIEIMIAVWLSLSPFIFRAQESSLLVWTDFLTASAITILAALSYWPPTRYAHLFTLLIAIGLILYGRFGFDSPVPPEQQNHIVIGLLLLMIAIIPNEASRPPHAWRAPVELPSNQPPPR